MSPPTYDYECRECGRVLEEDQNIHDDPLTHKRHIKKFGTGEPCNGSLKRLLSAVSHTWKGGSPTGKTYE